MPATISHALSATTPDDPAYEIRPTHWNSSHALTLNAAGSEISGAFGNGGGITFGLSADGFITASAPAAAPSPINFSAGTTSGNLGSVVFSDSNGLAFQLSGSTITGSYSQSTHAHPYRNSTDAVGLNTAQTNVTWTVNSSGLSLNAGGYAGTGFTSTTTAGTDVKATNNTAGLSMAVPAYLTTQSVQTQNLFMEIVSGANGNLTASSGTLSVKAGNNITLSTGAGVYSIHGVAAQTVQSQNFVALIASGANGNGTFTSGTVSLKNGSNITMSTGANVISFFAGDQSNAHNLLGANTAGNTTATGLTIGLSGLNLTLSGTNNSQIVISAPATTSVVGTSGITISTNGSTLSVQPVPMSQWSLGGVEISQAGSAQANSLVSIQPFFLNWPLAFSNIRFAASVNVASAANNSSAYIDLSLSAVVYTRNASTLSSLFSFSNSMTQSWSSNATGTVTGVPAITATCVATTLTPGDYWMAVHVSTNNTATGGANTTALANTVSMMLQGPHHVDSAANLIKQWGAQTNASQGLISGQGIFSTGATLASIAFSDYVATGTRGALAGLYFGLRNATFQG